MRKVAEFLEIPILEEHFEEIVKRCTFEHMHANADSSVIVPLRGAIMEGGAKQFLFKGTNGRWKDVISDELISQYQDLVNSKLTPEAAAWLENGADSGVSPKLVL